MSAEPADPPTARCPICGRPVDQRFRPFCSRRCQDQDLLNWLSGRYAVPAVETDAEDDQDG
jgi:endogenous inhibitor of DNA gyrase (YacG/DUF329 family)